MMAARMKTRMSGVAVSSSDRDSDSSRSQTGRSATILLGIFVATVPTF